MTRPRACLGACRDGCRNCRSFDVETHACVNFTGVAAILNPAESWIARWLGRRESPPSGGPPASSALLARAVRVRPHSLLARLRAGGKAVRLIALTALEDLAAGCYALEVVGDEDMAGGDADSD